MLFPLTVTRGIMPHVIIEYADTLETQISPQDLLAAVHQTVEASGLFNAADIRSRVQVFQHFRLGVQQPHFLHISIRLFAGRTDVQKAQLTQSVLQSLQQLRLLDVLISCECVDIHKASYQQIAL